MPKSKGGQGRCMRKRKRPTVSQYDMAQRILSRLSSNFRDNSPVSNLAQLQIMEIITQDMRRMRSGDGGVDEVARLAGQVSVTMLMCQANVAGSAQFLAVALAARDALERCANKHEETGVWRFDGPGIQAMDEFVELRDALLSTDLNTTEIEIQAREFALNEIRKGNAIRYEVAHG